MPKNRSENCELCTSTEGLEVFELSSSTRSGADTAVLLCSKCREAVKSNDFSDINHWRTLQEAIWSEHTPVKVLSYRILSHLRSESWVLDLIDQIYLEEEDLTWAREGIQEDATSGAGTITKDSNGTPLEEGDSVTLIKDLEVKGAGFTAKRGTLVKNIRLTENPEHIEGKVNGTTIVLVAKFMKKVVT